MEGGVYLAAGATRQSQQLCILSPIEDRPLVGGVRIRTSSSPFSKRLGSETARLIEICLVDGTHIVTEDLPLHPLVVRLFRTPSFPLSKGHMGIENPPCKPKQSPHHSIVVEDLHPIPPQRCLPQVTLPRLYEQCSGRAMIYKNGKK
ncbi:hypothetical protein CEXT_143971 [Caerostris extrusa]|uniref:Uncharacterized protein n=1 Tax=Caerostris extrusa TaxID=172846 RepID=A0AAV4NXF7_CAEEX|nr:hypothetical protein CEXT_143971 [Caerostris extrusa]